jgi:chemotaxis protein MotB
MTPEGLRIQIVDSEGKPMFASGSAEMFDYTQNSSSRLRKSSRHCRTKSPSAATPTASLTPPARNTRTGSFPPTAPTPRAACMLDTGLPATRINNVVGKADTDHLVPDKPTDAKNRRISIILLKEELTNPDFDKKAAEEANETGDAAEDVPDMPEIPIGTFKKTPGKVEFP